VITLRDVSFGFSNGASRPFIDSVNLAIPDGEWVAIAGGNGSGKSTLCRLMAGLYSPAAGTVEIDGAEAGTGRNEGGRAAAGAAPAFVDRRRVPDVGIAFQNPDSQFVTSSVAREILFGMENCAVPAGELESRVASAARLFRLDRYLSRNPHTISGGEKQRLLLACLWSMGPRHLILDEPFSFLDGESRTSFLEALRRSFRNEGKTIIWSTVDQDEVALADRVVFLEKGRVLFDGFPQGLAVSVPAGVLSDSLVHREAEGAAARVNSSRVETTDTAAIVEIRGASFSPGDSTFVLDVPSFAASPGDCIGVCGASGSGKTTFLLGCAGLLPPRKGAVTLFGKRVSSRRDFPAGRVAYLFQMPEEGFFAPTVREEVALAHKNFFGAPGEEAAVARALVEVGLEPGDYLDRNPFHLSQGEKRLVALASILVLGADVFMFDEPTIFLDGVARRRLRTALERMGSRGAPVIIASHDRPFLETVAGRVATITDGTLA
jgi:energy-coupling factor transporter ATP-binding protein EcfA2